MNDIMGLCEDCGAEVEELRSFSDVAILTLFGSVYCDKCINNGSEVKINGNMAKVRKMRQVLPNSRRRQWAMFRLRHTKEGGHDLLSLAKRRKASGKERGGR